MQKKVKTWKNRENVKIGLDWPVRAKRDIEGGLEKTAPLPHRRPPKKFSGGKIGIIFSRKTIEKVRYYYGKQY